MPRRVRPWLPVLALLLALPVTLSADVLVPKRGKRVEGAVVSEDASGVVFNRYFSTHPAVTNPDHLLRLAPDQVKRVERVPRPEVEIWRRHAALAADDVEGRVALGTYAKETKQKAAAKRFFAEALALDPTHKAALKGVGGKGAWQKLRNDSLHLDAHLREAVTAWLQAETAGTRAVAFEAVVAAGGQEKSPRWDRMVASAAEPNGRFDDVPLSMQADVLPGARFTLYVPRGYSPIRTWPLIIALHGGGPGGKGRDEVVGSGPSAMNFYSQLAEARGYLVACPTALQAPWSVRINHTFVRALIDEMTARFHVDLDRVYLTGHSMGGFGSWALGPVFAEELAAVAPAAGGGGTLGPLKDTRTPIHIFHSADDAVVGPASDRAQAKALLGTGHDFVYTELPNAGHGYPDSVRAETFTFFDHRRLWMPRRKSALPRSSFDRKPTKAEERYLGDRQAQALGTRIDDGELLDRLARGGGTSQRAAALLQGRDPEEVCKGVRKVLGSAKHPPSARAAAAGVLAALRPDGAVRDLGSVLTVEPSRDHAPLVRAAAQALATLSAAEGRGSVERALKAWSAFFQGKDQGGRMHYADWARATPVLLDLVKAWAACAEPDVAVRVLLQTVAGPVFDGGLEVQTSARVPQDPGAMRRALGAALGGAFKAAYATDGDWTALAEALASHPAAAQAASAQK